jgi:hypothetical protein
MQRSSLLTAAILITWIVGLTAEPAGARSRYWPSHDSYGSVVYVAAGEHLDVPYRLVPRDGWPSAKAIFRLKPFPVGIAKSRWVATEVVGAGHGVARLRASRSGYYRPAAVVLPECEPTSGRRRGSLFRKRRTPCPKANGSIVVDWHAARKATAGSAPVAPVKRP